MSDVTIKGVLLAMLIASVIAFAGMTINVEGAAVYSVNTTGNSTDPYTGIQDESAKISEDMEQIQDWLQELTSGDVLGFVFAMPSNVAKILGLFVLVPNLLNSIFTSILAVFGIPVFITHIFEVMMIVVVLLIIAGIWATEGSF